MSDMSRLAPRRRWLAGALVFSLAVNAFLAGAIATDLLRLKWRPGDVESRAFRFELRWLEGRLDAGAMRQVEAAIALAQPKALAHIERLRQLRADLASLAAVAEPDRAAIDIQLAAIRAEVEVMQAEVQDATIDALMALPPVARSTLAGPADTAR